MPRFLTACAVLLLAAAPVRAADWVDLEDRFSAEQRAATGLDTLTPAQLAELNRLLRGEETAAEQRRADTAAAEARERERVDPARFVGLADEPIVAVATGEITGWEPGFEFRLDNGQVWKVLKGHFRLRAPLSSPRVEVVPGLAGRWFLQVDPDLPKARVYRVD